MGVLFAQKSDIGRWQIFSKQSNAFVDLVTDQTGLLLPDGIVSDATSRAPLQISRYMRRLACEFWPPSNSSAGDDGSFTTPQDATCWQQVRKPVAKVKTRL
jgi:hypothetical protein